MERPALYKEDFVQALVYYLWGKLQSSNEKRKTSLLVESGAPS